MAKLFSTSHEESAERVSSLRSLTGAKFRHSLLRASCLILPSIIVLFGSQAVAQQQRQEAQVEEIVVTATRVAEALSRVPISISALSQDQLAQQRIKGIDDLIKSTPGVNFTRNQNNSTNISIRGLSSSTGAGTTGIYIDDTPVHVRQANNSFSTGNAYPELFDIDRVEILRGPQGTLFGSGTVGGAIRFISPQPSLTTYSARARTEFSFTEDGDSSHEVGVAAGGPITEGLLGFRASAYFRRDGGWIDRIARYDFVRMLNAQASMTTPDFVRDAEHHANWGATYAFRLALAFEPVENLRITPSLIYQNRYHNYKTRIWGAFSDLDRGEFISGSPVSSPDRDKFWLPSLNIQYDFSNFSLVSNSSYLRRKNPNWADYTEIELHLTLGGRQTYITAFNWLPNFPEFAGQGLEINNYKVFSQEVRAQSADADAKFRWVAGGFYSWSFTHVEDHAPLSPEDCDRFAQGISDPQGIPIGYQKCADAFFGVDLVISERTGGWDAYDAIDQQWEKEVAGFINASYEILDGLRFSAGFRLSRLELEAKSTAIGPFFFTPVLVEFGGTSKKTSVTPKAGIAYQLDDKNLFYFDAAKGFRGGGPVTPLIPTPGCLQDLADLGFAETPTSYAPDTVWSYEVGAKNRTLNNRLSVNSAVYYSKWKGIQQGNYLPGCNAQIQYNGNDATSKGFDLSVNALITDSFTMQFNLGYTKATFAEDLVIGARIPLRKGNWLEGVTPWKMSVLAQYQFEAYGHDAFWQADYQYQAGGPQTAALDPNSSTFRPTNEADPETHNVDLRGGVQVGAVQVALFVDNLLNQNPRFGGGRQVKQYFVLRPRTIGMSLSYRY